MTSYGADPVAGVFRGEQLAQDELTPGRSGFDVFLDLLDLQKALERRDPFSEDRRKPASASVWTDPSHQVRELCHDLRQPIAVSAALAATLAGEGGLSTDGTDRLALLRRQLQQLSELVAASLTPACRVRVDLGDLALEECSSVDVVDWSPVEAVLDREVVIEADAVQLRRLLLNLLANARRAAGSRGLVRVCVRRQSRYAVLEVHDSGTGTPTAERSTGLGLLIATGIAERHGGWIESGPSELGGVRVRVLIPLGGAEGMA